MGIAVLITGNIYMDNSKNIEKVKNVLINNLDCSKKNIKKEIDDGRIVLNIVDVNFNSCTYNNEFYEGIRLLKKIPGVRYIALDYFVLEDAEESIYWQRTGSKKGYMFKII